MTRLLVPVALLLTIICCVFSAEWQVNREDCSPTSYCADGFKCCSTTKCCPINLTCCGNGTDCCGNSNGIVLESARRPIYINQEQ
uniref:Cysteine rich secreted protein n=1 Tax=Riptortus pedestris TaxID=329032 RepID=R4WR73_RIPPE|nr:cysteine rich secreted protein [Riptortus pedestris]